MNPSDCRWGDRKWAEQLLGDQLGELEAFQFEEHLEHCATCQANLVEVAGGKHTLQYARDLLGSSVELPQSPPVLALDDTKALPLNEAEGVPITRDSLAVELSILGPTDDPNYLGRIGNYEVQGVIGRGGMGVVFRALDRALNRHVAIKVLDPSMASVDTARQRFAMEARAMAAISHEHVVPVYTVDEHRELPYFAMEYIPGGTLESRIRSQGPLDTLSVLRIARQIALALSAAHECGLVHRDIKPANVLLDRGVERVRVADFGLARVSSEASHTRSGFIAGTPQFMSPEQVRGEVCTQQSDLFSLGSVMYAMCTGVSPFQCESIYGTMQRVVNDVPRPIRDIAPETPEWLARFIDVLINKDSRDRFQSASNVAELLEREIAYSQNPSASNKPDRTQYSIPTIRPMWMQQAFWLAVLPIALATIWLAFAFVPGVVKDQQQHAEVMQPSVTVSTVEILWNKDDVKGFSRTLFHLERQLFSTEPVPATDPWDREIRDLTRKIESFEERLP